MGGEGGVETRVAAWETELIGVLDDAAGAEDRVEMWVVEFNGGRLRSHCRRKKLGELR